MAVRPIDANELYRIEKLLDTDIVRQDKVALNLLEQVLYDIQHVPALTQPNEPLTLEELREMDGQPVWVKLLKPNKYINPPTGWRILEKSLAGTFGVWDGEDNLVERCYGTDWLAYRRPPEGEEKYDA